MRVTILSLVALTAILLLSIPSCGEDEVEGCPAVGQIDCNGSILQECTAVGWLFLSDCAANNMRCTRPQSGPAACVPMVCGDGYVDTPIGEVCDGDWKPCVEIDPNLYSSGEVICAYDCSQYITNGCGLKADCGNGEVGVGEVCDGGQRLCKTILNEDQLPLYEGGVAACLSDCSGYDSSTCLSPCPDDNKFCLQHNGRKWSSLVTAGSLNELDTLCQSMGGRLPTISELRSIIHSCPVLEPGGGCPISETCTTDDCWTTECTEGCYDDEGLLASFSAFGDYGDLLSSTWRSQTGHIWAVFFRSFVEGAEVTIGAQSTYDPMGLEARCTQ